LPDDTVCIGDRYQIGNALFEVTQPRLPVIAWAFGRTNHGCRHCSRPAGDQGSTSVFCGKAR
jgi:MOSC domain-containing protein YiiM